MDADQLAGEVTRYLTFFDYDDHERDVAAKAFLSGRLYQKPADDDTWLDDFGWDREEYSLALADVMPEAGNT